MRRRAAILLLRLATSILPAARAEWARDMRSELDYVESDGAALTWALGCVWAGVWGRATAMLNSNGQISKWILALEWLVCFAPITLLWGVALAMVVGRQDVSVGLVVPTLVGTLGPIALFVSMAATFGHSSARFAKAARGLAVGFGLLSILQLVAAASDGRLTLQWFEFNGSVFVLLSLLPLFGCLHLAHLSQTPSARAA
jgi:hypothetical protein